MCTRCRIDRISDRLIRLCVHFNGRNTCESTYARRRQKGIAPRRKKKKKTKKPRVLYSKFHFALPLDSYSDARRVVRSRVLSNASRGSRDILSSRCSPLRESRDDRTESRPRENRPLHRPADYSDFPESSDERPLDTHLPVSRSLPFREWLVNPHQRDRIGRALMQVEEVVLETAG